MAGILFCTLIRRLTQLMKGGNKKNKTLIDEYLEQSNQKFQDIHQKIDNLIKKFDQDFKEEIKEYISQEIINEVKLSIRKGYYPYTENVAL